MILPLARGTAVRFLPPAPETFAATVVVAGLAIEPNLAWKRMRGEPPASLAAPAVSAPQE